MVINGIYKHKRSSTAGKVPLATDLQVGELAINTTDAILYTKTDSGAVISLNQSYTKAESDARYVPQGILPITRIGDLSTSNLPIVAGTGFNFTVTADIPVLLGGRFSKIEAGSYAIANIDNGSTTNPASKTINVYVTFASGDSSFAFYTTNQAEAYSLVFIGTITTGVSGITAISLAKVSRLDVYRVSLTSRGSAIPVTGGNPATTGTFDASWNI